MMAQEPGWFKNNHGSRTMMAQEPYTVAQNNDGSIFSKLQAISKQCNQGQAKCKLKVDGFAQLDTSDGKPMTKSLIDTIDGPCRRSKEATILTTWRNNIGRQSSRHDQRTLRHVAQLATNIASPYKLW
jgi:hypothetical protein